MFIHMAETFLLVKLKNTDREKKWSEMILNILAFGDCIRLTLRSTQWPQSYCNKLLFLYFAVDFEINESHFDVINYL